MGILTKLQTQGSLLTNLAGSTPDKYSGVNSVLNPESLKGSQLDLNGTTPDNYIDNLPK